jgi:VanZ family protein
MWAGVIFGLSGPAYSSTASAGVLAAIAKWLASGFLHAHEGLLNVALRKSAHFSEYAVFAIFLYHSFKPANRSNWSSQSAAIALFFASLYSLTDEFHQLFVPGRQACLTDCLIDTTGAFIGLFVFFRAVHAVWNNAPTSLAN